MRIIKEGRKPKTEIETTCDRCGCVFAYEAKDVKYDQREKESWVRCPQCGIAIAVEPFSGY